ncbi:hypothetical protein [Streptomyces sp. NPDC001537]
MAPRTVLGAGEQRELVTGRVRLDAPVIVSAPGRPDSPARVIKQGAQLKVAVEVADPGPAMGGVNGSGIIGIPYTYTVGLTRPPTETTAADPCS